MQLFEHNDDLVFLLCEYIYSVYFILFSGTIALIFVDMDSILVLNGENFKDWKESMEMFLGCMGLDLALRMEKPNSSTKSGTSK